MLCALRAPKSETARPLAARTMRDVFVAMRDWWLNCARIAVSTIWASMSGAVTVMMGSPGNITVPSSKAHTSPRNLYPLRNSRNPSSNIWSESRYSISSSSKCIFSMYSTICSNPANMAYPPLSGTFLKNTSKVARSLFLDSR